MAKLLTFDEEARRGLVKYEIPVEATPLPEEESIPGEI